MKRLITIIRRPFGCLILFIAACNNSPTYKSYVPTSLDSARQQAYVERAGKELITIKRFVKSGDVVTRTGNDFTSQSLRNLNQRDRTYSHCGIASIEHDTIFIYHALGGDFNPDQKIRRDPIERFAHPSANKGIGVFRFIVADSIVQRITTAARCFYQKEVMFDMAFDLASDNRMYCTEFVYKSIQIASGNEVPIHHSRIREFEFIGVDDIFLHPKCRKQAELIFK